jgi:hypothetical protein
VKNDGIDDRRRITAFTMKHKIQKWIDLMEFLMIFAETLELFNDYFS